MIEIVLRYADELRIGSVGSLGDQWLVQTLKFLTARPRSSFSRFSTRMESLQFWALGSGTEGQSSGSVSCLPSPPSRRRTKPYVPHRCKTSSQILCAPAVGCAAACSAETRSRTSRTDGPCHASPSSARPNCSSSLLLLHASPSAVGLRLRIAGRR